MTLLLLLLAPLLEAAACGLLRSRQWMERVSVISAAINLVLGVVLVRNVARFHSVSLLMDSCMPTHSALWWSR